MASGKYVNCPQCGKRFFVGDEFFVLPEARCHCPYCSHEFAVNGQAAATSSARPQGAPTPH
jgi:DNA-directed RNA polymerase subunit RPC12/RpoP